MKKYRHVSIVVGSLLSVLLFVGCADEGAEAPSGDSASGDPSSGDAAADEYRAKIEAWQKDRDEGLADPEG